jgi:hypothetical protein
LTFANAAVTTGVAARPSGGYLVRWSSFDNNTHTASPIGSPTVAAGTDVSAPGPLPAAGFIKLEVSAVQPPDASWTKPVDVYFRRAARGWVLVGIDRMPATADARAQK